ncbi:PAS domain S-box protein [Thermodesulfitimonas autotrophica]|uniref:PAS domain S-box protein n=1 Tax=Thermodesulfitimonas autotrophica TaxID=1894989 RepID=UPI002FDF1668
MTLKKKVLQLFGLTAFCMGTVFLVALKTIVLNSLLAHEKMHLAADVERVLYLFTEEGRELQAKISFLAQRDDTCAFVRRPSPDYVRSNLPDAVLGAQRLDLIAFIDSTGKVVWGKAFYRDQGWRPVLPEGFLGSLAAGEGCFSRMAKAPGGLSGLGLLPGGPALVAAVPVMPGTGTGPSPGAVIAGRYLDPEEVKHLARKAGLTLDVWALTPIEKMPPDAAMAAQALLKDPEKLYARLLSPEAIAGYTLAKGLCGEPVLLLRVTAPRTVYQQGQRSLLYLFVIFVAVGALLGGITIFAFYQTVLSRLAYLNAAVRRIGMEGDLTTRVTVAGNDELADFAREINKMLAALEQSKQLRESEERYRALFDQALTGNYIALAYGRVLLCNPAYVRMFGFSSCDEALATDFFSLFPDEAAKEAFLGLLREKKKLELHEATFRRRDGQLITVVQNVIGTFDQRGELLQLQGYLFDITARKKAEEALARAKRQNELLLEAVGEGIYGVDPEGKTTFVNPAALQMTGYAAEEVIGLQQHAMLHHTRADGTPYPEAACPVHATLRDGQPRSVTGEVFWRKDGSSFPVDYTCTPVREGEKIVGAVVVFRDVTARQRAEQALREAHTQIKQLVASISSILIGLDADGCVKHWNGPATETFGLAAEAVVGRPLSASGIEWEWEKVARGIAACRERQEPVRVDDVRYLRRDGKPGFLGLTVTPLVSEEGEHLGYVILAADITERKNEETQRVLRQKLESLGQLAAGIAHEINTPMQYVGDNTTFLQDAFAALSQFVARCQEFVAQGESGVVPADELAVALAALDWEFLGTEIPKALEQSLEGIGRVRKLVLAMKEFAHPGKKEKAPYNLNRAVESTVTISRNEWKYVADLEMDLDPDLPPVPCVVDEINQVVLNMIINAVHAIETVVNKEVGEKGKIIIRTRREGDFAKIEISDTGSGIPPAIIDRIFDPFFTTKEVGKGSGQGLAIAHDIIVNKHRGNITVESEVGKGTTFTVYLPLNPPEEERREQVT